MKLKHTANGIKLNFQRNNMGHYDEYYQDEAKAKMQAARNKLESEYQTLITKPLTEFSNKELLFLIDIHNNLDEYLKTINILSRLIAFK